MLPHTARERERERDTERETERERETDRQTDRERERERTGTILLANQRAVLRCTHTHHPTGEQCTN